MSQPEEKKEEIRQKGTDRPWSPDEEKLPLGLVVMLIISLPVGVLAFVKFIYELFFAH